MTARTTLEIATGISAPTRFTSSVTTRPKFVQYSHMSFGSIGIAHSSNSNLYGVRFAQLSTHMLTPDHGVLELIVRRMWPVATFQLIQNVLQLSDELLEYVDEPPNLLAVINAGKELQKLSIYQLLPKCISAMGDGGICLTWPLERFYGGLSCYNDGDITLNYRVRSGESTRVINPTCQDLSTFAAVMRECH